MLGVFFIWYFFSISVSVLHVTLGAARSVKSSPAGTRGDVTAQESSDWLEMMWTFAVSLIAPDEEEGGIHQLTESLTCKRSSHAD